MSWLRLPRKNDMLQSQGSVAKVTRTAFCFLLFLIYQTTCILFSLTWSMSLILVSILKDSGYFSFVSVFDLQKHKNEQTVSFFCIHESFVSLATCNNRCDKPESFWYKCEYAFHIIMALIEARLCSRPLFDLLFWFHCFGLSAKKSQYWNIMVQSQQLEWCSCFIIDFTIWQVVLMIIAGCSILHTGDRASY